MTTLTGLRVLVVDDDRETAELYDRLLALAGAKTMICTRPLECADLVEAFLPHAILLDVGLPDITGIELARRIRSNAKLQPTPMLIASTGFHTGVIQAAVGTIFDHYLLKPYSSEALFAVLQPLHARLDPAGNS